MIEDLLKCLHSYVVSMAYKGKDFLLRVELVENMMKKFLAQQKHIF